MEGPEGVSILDMTIRKNRLASEVPWEARPGDSPPSE